MKLVRVNESSILSMQKYVKLQSLCVFNYCDKNVTITLLERQDVALFVLVHDRFEEFSFYFQIFDADAIDIFSFSKFRKDLIRLYFCFLHDFREKYNDLPF